MVLHIHNDGSYISAPKARSRAGGHFFLSNALINPKTPPANQPYINDPVHSTCHILRNVMYSSAEAEFSAHFYNGQEAVPICVTLEELGHTQLPTPIQTANSTASRFVNNTIKKTPQSNAHALLLDLRPRPPRKPSSLLASWL